ncbi:hypothetical protein B566_EDAN011772 [Ephemera danica]|nr:hypothetical protein B566_EDAN011772 [Ephemera danica]
MIRDDTLRSMDVAAAAAPLILSVYRKSTLQSQLFSNVLAGSMRNNMLVSTAVFLAVLLASTAAQQFNFQQQQHRPQRQQPQQSQFRFTGQDFPNFSQQGSQQVSNFFRPSQQHIQQQPFPPTSAQPSVAPAQAIQPPLPTFSQNNFQNQNGFQNTNTNSFPTQNQNSQFQQQNPNAFQGVTTFQGQPVPQQQQPQQNHQQNFQQQQPQQNFQQPQQNFQQPQQNFQPSFNAPRPAAPTFATPPQPSQSSFPVQRIPELTTTTSTTTTPPAPTISQELQRQFTQQLRQRQEVLHQLGQSQTSQTPQQSGSGAVFLANGQKLQVLTVNPKSVTPAPAPRKPAVPAIQAIDTDGPSGLLDAVTKGVIPSGVNYEVIRQKQDGNLENVKGLPSDLPKKVTFVILEEQDDGSYKVQGVRKGAGIPEGADIAAEAAKAATAGEDETQEVQSLIKKLQDGRLKLPSQNQQPPVATRIASTTPRHTTPRATTTTTTTEPPFTFSPPRANPTFSRPTTNFLPTVVSPTFSRNQGSEASQSTQIQLQVPSPTTTQLKKSQSPTNMSEVLRSQGLRSMAQFLEQVGLDRALNDSAPFTMFAPTDLAFRALLLELGGADRAQAKFRTSPRLLSGLLLHHVIPGSFQVSDLQDEMTGVSLAGTQLRVNVYTGTDSSFNTRKVVTINGGSVSERSTDISLPAGSVVHAVNRVLFPLPVGDLLTSLEADPARRFSRFVRAVRDAGLEDILKAPLPDSPDDGRTYTVFAPTDEAINSAVPELVALLDGAETSERRSALRTLLERHIAPGVFKVNSARVVTPDIPATNGVIHAIDSII